MVSRNYIYRLFGDSPVRPLQKHMTKVFKCINELPAFVKATYNNDWDEAAKLRSKIADLESDADKLKKQLRMHLPKGVMLPVDRRDLLEVLTMQDKIANRAQDIAGLMVGRHMVIPASMQATFTEFMQRSVEAAAMARKAVNEMDELVETGFRGKEVTLVESILNDLDDIESDSDRLQREIRSQLFEIEKELDPVDVMFLYKVIDGTGDLADLAERVGSRLQLLLAR